MRNNMITVEQAIGASKGHWMPVVNDDLSAISELVTANITEFWQVIRYTADGPVVLGIYGGPDAEQKARRSWFARNGASVSRASHLRSYRDACKAASRETTRNVIAYDMGRPRSQADLLKREAYRKTREFYAAVRELVEERPGLTPREVIGGVSHHYVDDKSAYNALRHLFLSGIGLEGVRAQWSEDGTCRLYPREES